MVLDLNMVDGWCGSGVEVTVVEVEINSPCNLWDHEMGYISNKT